MSKSDMFSFFQFFPFFYEWLKHVENIRISSPRTRELIFLSHAWRRDRDGDGSGEETEKTVLVDIYPFRTE